MSIVDPEPGTFVESEVPDNGSWANGAKSRVGSGWFTRR